MNNKFSSILDLVLKIAGVAGVVATIGSFILQWTKGISTQQIILILVALFCFILAGVVLFLQWHERRKFEHIPDILEKMDKMVLDYIEDSAIELEQDEWKILYRELGSLLSIDLGQFQYALEKQGEEQIETEFSRITRAYNRHADVGQTGKRFEKTLTDLLDMGSVMDCHNIGLENFKKTKEFQKLSSKLTKLQRKAPSVNISTKVNEYLNWSEGFYSMLLSMKPIYENPLLIKIMPIKVKAKKSQVRPMIERQTSTLITAVRESIDEYKNKYIDEKK